MKGIHFVVDEKDNRTKEPRESLESVKKRLQGQGKLDW